MVRGPAYMPIIQRMAWVVLATDQQMPRISDLAIRDPGQGAVLYATTRYGGAVTAWSMAGTGLARIDSAAHIRADLPGAVAGLGFLTLSGGGLGLLSGGGVGGAMVLHPLQGDGGFGAAGNLGTFPTFADDLIHTVTVSLGGGAQTVYGGIAGASGIGRLSFSATGSLTGQSRTADTVQTHADRVTALATAQVGGQDYLFSASTTDPGITVWTISATGALSVASNLGVAEDLWIAAPTALEVAVVAGKSYLILAAAGSSSLSVMQIMTDGSLQQTDHVLDDLGSRFAGVTALATLSHAGQSYVVAGGADDGISLFQLLPDGRLLALAHLADSTTMGLADISAISLQSRAQGLDIFVASASEAGLTRLRVELGAAGIMAEATPGGGALAGSAGSDMLCGADAADQISAGAGDDVLIDGAGADTLTGGTGADIFVLSDDGALDRILDFTPGQDRLDLSEWGYLRNLGQLDLVSTATGMRITYGDEVLDLHSASGTPISRAQLSFDMLVPQTRIPPVLSNTPGVYQSGTDIIGTIASERLVASAEGNQLFGNGGQDTLLGGAGQDRLFGGSGHDRLSGNGGDDVLTGGVGNDILWGGAGSDRAIFGLASTMVSATAGSNSITLMSAEGRDVIYDDVEFFVFTDRTLTYAQAALLVRGAIDGTAAGDVLTGTAQADLIRGLGGGDWITPGRGNDTVDGGTGADMVSFSDQSRGGSIDLAAGLALFGTEADRLVGIENVTASSYADLITGDAGTNRLRGMGDYDWFIGSGGGDLIEGGNGRDMMSYQNAMAGVTVDLGQKKGLAGQALGDVYDSIERASGSSYADVFYGDVAENDFRGFAGNDLFYGSAGGRERYDGGAGVDMVSYGTSSAGVIASLQLGYGTGGDAARDLYTEIENLTGSSYADRLTGDGGRNMLRGLAGDDLLFGGAGVDQLYGGAGRDVMDGGAGSDYAYFSGTRSQFTLTRTGAETVSVTGLGAALSQGRDSLIHVEYFVFSDRTVSIWDL